MIGGSVVSEKKKRERDESYSYRRFFDVEQRRMAHLDVRPKGRSRMLVEVDRLIISKSNEQ